LGSSFAKTGDEIKRQDENSAQETKRGCSTLTGVSPPVFAFALNCCTLGATSITLQ
jgi:hypothetical protein